MAMFILHTHESVWHQGEKLEHVNAHDVRLVQADGDELRIILQQFHNLPTTGERIIRWYGDDAKFIVGNLRDHMRSVR